MYNLPLNSELHGNKDLIEKIKLMISYNSNNSFLIGGPVGVGKANFVYKLSRFLLCHFEDFSKAELKNKENNFLIEGKEFLKSLKKKDHDKLFFDPENIKLVKEAMFASTNEVRGTSYSSRIKNPKYQFAGKTGTSQVMRITEKQRELDLKTQDIPYNERDHALYIAFGPYKNPRYALSVVIEHGGSGSSTAAPIAKKLFKLIIDRHEFREKIKNNKKSKV